MLISHASNTPPSIQGVFDKDGPVAIAEKFAKKYATTGELYTPSAKFDEKAAYLEAKRINRARKQPDNGEPMTQVIYEDDEPEPIYEELRYVKKKESMLKKAGYGLAVAGSWVFD